MNTQSDSDGRFSERLAASKAEFEERQFAEGKARGEKWARVQASFESLRRLAFIEDEEGYYDIEAVVEALEGRDEPQRLAEYAIQYFGYEYPSTECLRGFVEGALDAARGTGISLD